ncbi:MAG: sulfotransferase, partial [Pseudomonadota bacterium]|nr:sulfotransferase [Pseudomonadota bacterium]
MSDSGTSGPIFIVGGSRTGSELHRTILTHSPRIDLVEEMWLLCPSWLHTDFATHLERSVGPLMEQGAIDRLMDLMYSKKPFGYFWSVIDRDLAPEALRAALLQSEPTLRGVFDAILTAHAQAKGKPIRGAKFPVHYSYVDLLVEWFPDCKIIHTVRDPRAVYASQASKYVRPRQALYERARLRILHFMH